MPVIETSLSGLLDFIVYFVVAVAMLLIFMKLYIMITPHNEIALIKENNLAASLAFGGTLIGFSLPLASAAANSIGIFDFIIWGVVAGVTQVLVYLVFRVGFPKITTRIQEGENAASLLLGAISISIGLLNAACMTY